MTTSIEQPPQTLPISPVSPQETLQGEDRAVFEMAKMQRQLAIARAEKVLAETQTTEAEFKVMLMRLYMKLGLNPEKDSIDEQGHIRRNAQKKDA